MPKVIIFKRLTAPPPGSAQDDTVQAWGVQAAQPRPRQRMVMPDPFTFVAVQPAAIWGAPQVILELLTQ